MATSYRVRKDEFSPDCQMVMDDKRNEYCIDPQAGILEGKIANFETFDTALAYGKKWLQIS